MYNIKRVHDTIDKIKTLFKLSFSNEELYDNTSAVAWLKKPSLVSKRIESCHNSSADSLSRKNKYENI